MNKKYFKEALEKLKELGSKINNSDLESTNSFSEYERECECTGGCANGCAMTCYAEANGYLVPPND